MPETQTRPRVQNAGIMALIAWSMCGAIAGLFQAEEAVVRVLCLGWVLLGVYLLGRRLRSA